jgi:hypothetical protein
MRLLVFFLFFSTYCIAQNIDFEGYVVDSKTDSPIPYVNISFLNTLKGTSTDEEGHFLLEIPKDFLNKQVHVSSLGYQDTLFIAEQLHSSKKLKMVEETFELAEVVITKNLGDAGVLNPINSRSITSGFDSSSTPWILALYFPNIGAAKKYLNKVTVFFRENNNFKREASKFRLRFFDVDKTKMPGKDLTNKSLVLEQHRGKDYVMIDVAEMNLKIPENGIYIGLEWLFVPSNWYRKKEIDNLTSKPIIEDRFAPTFAGVYSKNVNYKTVIYGMGEWRDFTVRSKNNTENFIPAVSLKISSDKKSKKSK